MSLVRVQNVTVRFGERVLLRDVSLRLGERERIGLVGGNGTGKTTLLRLILGLEAPAEGAVDVSLGTGIGYFSQHSELAGELSLQQILEDLFADVRGVEAELEAIGLRLESVSDADEMTALLEQQAFGLEQMEQRRGWDYGRLVDVVCGKLGFSEARRHQALDTLSGGWRNRASLARLLLQRPQVLLMDEPTNFLDVDGLAWLEGWLRGFDGALLLVSHDRQFLDQVVTRIVDVENYHLHDYPGTYTDYVRKKPFRAKTLQRQFAHEEELLTLEAEAIADRQELARNPSEGVQRKLADIKKRRAPRPLELIVTQIYQGLRVPDKLCRVEDAAKGYGAASGGQPLFEHISFEVERGDRLAIVGANGSGKSTLLRCLTGEEAPDSGRVVWESGVRFADFTAVQRALDPKDTVTHAVNTTGMAYSATRKQVGHFLGLLQFSEMDQQQKLGTLSGGQQARVALAQCLVSGAGVLILDEPTNHLDLLSTQVMEQALLYFPGAIVFVSHDRFFLDKVATRLLVFEPGRALRSFNGNWTMWQGAHKGEE